MKRWPRRIVIAAALVALVVGVPIENDTHFVRGWLWREPFYEGRPASYWADEIERWETSNPPWDNQSYERRSTRPRWLKRFLPEPGWPRLLDGDPKGLPVLQALREHPSDNVRAWAKTGIERIDNGERGQLKIHHPWIILTAHLYEVDDAYYQEVAKEKWLSQAELDAMEADFLAGRKLPGPSLYDRLGKQKLVQTVKDLKIDDRTEAVLLSLTSQIEGLPNREQTLQGRTEPQKIEVGLTLRGHMHISPDRRFVRVRFTEKIAELEGIDKVTAGLDRKGAFVLADVPVVKESTLSLQRLLPDGGGFLLPLQYRPDSLKDKGRRLVAGIVPRIYIEAEERWLQQQVSE